MITIALFSIIVAISYGIGKRLLNLIIKDTGSLIEDFMFSVGLGLGIIGYSVYMMGRLGFLYRCCVIAALIVFAILSFKPLARFLRTLNFDNIPDFVCGSGWFEKILMAVIALIPVFCLFGALAPEIGNDSLAYHLYHPKVFIENHKIGYIPFACESLWPYLTEMLFTIGLLFKSTGIAKLFHYFYGLLSALAVYAFARRFFGRREALLSAALFCSAPGIFMQSVYSYVDLSLCFYSFSALYLAMLWDNTNNVKFLVLSGIFTGLALSVKILGGFVLIALLPVILLRMLRRKASAYSVFRHLIIFLLSASVVSFVWYLHSYMILKNPVYPFLSHIFGNGWEDNYGQFMGVRKDLLGFLRLPWDFVINMVKFGEEQIGVISLAFLPCLFFLNPRGGRVTYPIVFLVFFTAIWFCIDQNIRFAFVDIAIMYTLIGVGFYNVLKKYRLMVLKVLLISCVLFNLSLCFYHNRDSIALAFGMTGSDNYLSNKERTYPAAKFINKNTPINSTVIFVGEPRAFYFDRRIIIYDLFKKASKENFGNFFNGLISEPAPVYILLRDDYIISRGDAGFYTEIQPIIKNASPIFKISREVDEGKIANYIVYKTRGDEKH